VTVSGNGRVINCKGLLLGSIQKKHKIWDSETYSEFTPMDTVHYYGKIVGFCRTLAAGEPSLSFLECYKETIEAMLRVSPDKTFPGAVDDTRVTMNTSILHYFKEVDSSGRFPKNMLDFGLNSFSLDLSRIVLAKKDLYIPNLNPKISQTITSELAPLNLGICWSFCQNNDILAILHGYPAPVVLRRKGNDHERFEIMGDVYVNGYMNGEALEKFEERNFEIC
jgi:hypothetical protein